MHKSKISNFFRRGVCGVLTALALSIPLQFSTMDVHAASSVKGTYQFDFNGKGIVDKSDKIYFEYILANQDNLDTYSMMIADANKNGAIDSYDWARILYMFSHPGEKKIISYYYYFDFNLNGIIDYGDMAYMEFLLLNQDKLPPSSIIAADMNQNGRVDSYDVARMNSFFGKCENLVII